MKGLSSFTTRESGFHDHCHTLSSAFFLLASSLRIIVSGSVIMLIKVPGMLFSLTATFHPHQKRKLKEKERELEKRKRKKEKVEKRAKGPITSSWGKYGLIKEIDMWFVSLHKTCHFSMLWDL